MIRFPSCFIALAAFLSVLAADATAHAEPLRVMTFNIRYGTANDGPNAWPRRRDAVVETIRRFDPDVLGVQEALAFQLDELQRSLTGLSAIGKGQDDGRRRGATPPRYRLRCEPVGRKFEVAREVQHPIESPVDVR
ncbi:MAG: endonuclease/exonuclease/phosphatase family protein [Planctomycetota bacterium]